MFRESVETYAYSIQFEVKEFKEWMELIDDECYITFGTDFHHIPLHVDWVSLFTSGVSPSMALSNIEKESIRVLKPLKYNEIKPESE